MMGNSGQFSCATNAQWYFYRPDQVSRVAPKDGLGCRLNPALNLQAWTRILPAGVLHLPAGALKQLAGSGPRELFAPVWVMHFRPAANLFRWRGTRWRTELASRDDRHAFNAWLRRQPSDRLVSGTSSRRGGMALAGSGPF